MASRLLALTFDALDPGRVADFWAGLLGWERTDDPAAGILPRPDEVGGLPLRFQRTDQPKTLQNLMHFDLVSESAEQQQETVARALALGARHVDVGQRPEEGHVVLADPEGNEMCVLPEGNRFLEGCGFLGAVSCDGTHDVGVFWAAALDWPLVWDQGDETAIQAPAGGTKITWGGPPLMQRPVPSRQHLDLVATGPLEEEVERLLSLGATRVGDAGTAGPWAVLADPDGGDFRVQPAAPRGL